MGIGYVILAGGKTTRCENEGHYSWLRPWYVFDPGGSESSPRIVLTFDPGGLACAIACLRQGLKVVLLERAPSIQPVIHLFEAVRARLNQSQVGAGIQIPPNATRIMRHFGLEDQLLQRGAVRIHSRNLLRYSDGKVLCSRPGFDAMVEDFGASY